MPVIACGTTTFEHQDFTGKVKVATAEGSSIAIPCEDLLQFASQYARALRARLLDEMPWQDVLGGK